MLLPIVGFGQSIFEQFGVKRYGNTHDQPFYYADRISQDSLNRLVFQYSSKIKNYDKVMVYDGQRFSKRKPLGRGQFLSKDTLRNVTWYRPDLFTAVAYRDDTLFTTIHTDDYFRLNFHRVLTRGKQLFVLTNSGILEYEWKGDELNYLRSIPVASKSGTVDDLVISGDTLYCRTNEGVVYKLYNDINTQYAVDLPNQRFRLPGNRIVRTDRYQNRIITSDTYQYDLIVSLINKSYKYLEDSHGRFWVNLTSGDEIGMYVYEQGSLQGIKIDR